MLLVTVKQELNKNEINKVLSTTATASHRHSNKHLALLNGSNWVEHSNSWTNGRKRYASTWILSIQTTYKIDKKKLNFSPNPRAKVQRPFNAICLSFRFAGHNRFLTPQMTSRLPACANKIWDMKRISQQCTTYKQNVNIWDHKSNNKQEERQQRTQKKNKLG